MPESAAAPLPSADDSTCARLIAGAAKVFAERGYEGTRVQEIARQAGLTTGAIYANFSGKDELLLEVVEQHAGDEIDELLRHGPPTGRTTLDVLEDLGAHLVDRDNDPEGPALLFEAFAAARRNPMVADFLVERFGLHGQLSEVVAQIREEGMFPEELDADAIVRFCQALMVGTLVLDAVGMERPSAEAWSLVIHRVADGLARRHD